MGVTLSTGPTVTSGINAGVIGGTPADPNGLAGPNVDYQASVFVDIRYPIQLGNETTGSIKAHLNSPYPCMTDAVPATAGTAKIAALANVVSGTAMTLVSTVSTGISVNLPIFLPATGGTATAGVTLDYGFDKLNVTSGSTAATVSAGSILRYTNGMWLVLCAGATPQFVQVLSGAGTTSLVLSAAANATNAAAPVGAGNVRDRFSSATATCSDPYLATGVSAPFNPREGLCRGLSITGSASGTGGAFKVVGYDIYGVAMTETITATSGATTTYGIKAWKHIVSVTPQFTDAHNYSVGTSDLFGINLRSDAWEYCNLFWAGAFLSASTGWTAAVTTSPATSTTGDVRGTIQIGTIGPGGSGATGGASDGTRRLALFASIPLDNLTAANINNPVPMYGVTQA